MILCTREWWREHGFITYKTKFMEYRLIRRNIVALHKLQIPHHTKYGYAQKTKTKNAASIPKKVIRSVVAPIFFTKACRTIRFVSIFDCRVHVLSRVFITLCRVEYWIHSSTCSLEVVTSYQNCIYFMYGTLRETVL